MCFSVGNRCNGTSYCQFGVAEMGRYISSCSRAVMSYLNVWHECVAGQCRQWAILAEKYKSAQKRAVAPDFPHRAASQRRAQAKISRNFCLVDTKKTQMTHADVFTLSVFHFRETSPRRCSAQFLFLTLCSTQSRADHGRDRRNHQ